MLDAFGALAVEKTPIGLSRLAERAGVQSGVGKAEARIGSSRAYLLNTLKDIYNNAAEGVTIDVPDRARVRLACTNAIHGAIETADWLYKNAGVDSIFAGSPYERRFRDIHTLSQQIQSRDSHYEAVGQVLLGQQPAVFF